MTEKRFTLKHINEQYISANLYDNKTFIGSIGIGEELIVELLNEFQKENEHLKQQLTDCKEKKQQMKEFFMNSEAIIEQKKLQKLIYKRVFNLIDEKIDEFKRGDYGDLPCNAIHMFLDLKEELGDFE